MSVVMRNGSVSVRSWAPPAESVRQADLDEINSRFAGAHPRDVLEWGFASIEGLVIGTGFQVGPEQERNLAHRLERVELRRNFCRRAHRYREPADLFLLNVLRQPPPLRRVAGYVIAEHARPDYLRRFLPQRHRGHHGISPARGCHGGAPSATGTTAQSRTARRERDER